LALARRDLAIRMGDSSARFWKAVGRSTNIGEPPRSGRCFRLSICDLVVADMGQARTALLSAQGAMKAGFGLTHTTIQIEDQNLRQPRAS